MTSTASRLDGTICLDFVNTAVDLEPLAGELSPSPGRAAATRRIHAILRRVLRAEAVGSGAAERDLNALNRVLARASGNRGLIPTVRGYGWGWLEQSDTTDMALWPVAFSAATLLAGPDRARLKACDGCGRLYLDASRNRSRRWCDMQGCGNRAKVRRHRARHANLSQKELG